MAKQRRPVDFSDSSKFFDEMQEKMEIEDIKRRKLCNKNSVQSQPELLFLQFKPNGKNSKDDCYFSNRQSTSDGNSHKKLWRPPIKVFNNYDDTLVLNKIHINNKTQEEAKGCNLLENWNDSRKSVQTVNFVCDESDNKTILEKETAFSLITKLNTSQTVNKSGENQRNNEDNDLLTPDVDNELHNAVCTCIDDETDDCSNEEIPFTQHIEQADKDFHNTTHVNDNGLSDVSPTVNMTDKINVFKDELAQEIYPAELCDVDKDCDVDNKNVGYDEPNVFVEAAPFEDMVAQVSESSVLREILNCNETRVNEVRDYCEFNDQQEIINAHEIIPSRRQEHDCQKETEDNELENDLEDENSGNVTIDSIFENNSLSENELDKPKKQNAAINENVVNCYKVLSCQENEVTIDCLEKNDEEEIEADCVLMDLEKKDNLSQESVHSKVTSVILSKRQSIINSDNNSVQSLEQIDFSDNNEERFEETSSIVEDKDNVADDEYSCLMISNSQLLEIEKSYYETPKNKEIMNSAQSTLDKAHSVCLTTNPDCLKKTVSIATQTDVTLASNYPSSWSIHQSVHTQLPPLQWPKKMEETQSKLIESIQEIERLNVMLMKVRQEVWPQRNPTHNSTYNL